MKNLNIPMRYLPLLKLSRGIWNKNMISNEELNILL